MLIEADFLALKLLWLPFLFNVGLPDVLVLLHFSRKGVCKAYFAVILKLASFYRHFLIKFTQESVIFFSLYDG